MRPNRSLRLLYEVLDYRLDRLLREFKNAGPAAADRDRLATYCAIEVGNAWDSFLRSFYLSCVTRARQRSGAVVRVSSGVVIATEHAAIIECLKATGRSVPTGASIAPREEPDWGSKVTILKVARHLSLSNVKTIENGFSVKTDVYEHMKTVRNFYAHRGQGTAKKISGLSQRLSLTNTRRATELLFMRMPRRPQTVFEQWVAECRIVAYGICE